MKQVKPMEGMPGINSAFTLPHIDKVLAIDDGTLPNAGTTPCHTAHGHVKQYLPRQTASPLVAQNWRAIVILLSDRSLSSGANNVSYHSNDQAHWVWMDDSDRDNLFFRIGLSLRLEVSEVWFVIIELPNTKAHRNDARWAWLLSMCNNSST